MLIWTLLQLHWLNLGLRKYDQLIVIPAYLVCYTTFSILGGAFYFREFESYSTEGYIFFPLGTRKYTLTQLAVCLVSKFTLDARYRAQ